MDRVLYTYFRFLNGRFASLVMSEGVCHCLHVVQIVSGEQWRMRGEREGEKRGGEGRRGERWNLCMCVCVCVCVCARTHARLPGV